MDSFDNAHMKSIRSMTDTIRDLCLAIEKKNAYIANMDETFRKADEVLRTKNIYKLGDTIMITSHPDRRPERFTVSSISEGLYGSEVQLEHCPLWGMKL